ncbi:unnamed protein product [Boreogadus saida]
MDEKEHTQLPLMKVMTWDSGSKRVSLSQSQLTTAQLQRSEVARWADAHVLHPAGRGFSSPATVVVEVPLISRAIPNPYGSLVPSMFTPHSLSLYH